MRVERRPLPKTDSFFMVPNPDDVMSSSEQSPMNTTSKFTKDAELCVIAALVSADESYLTHEHPPDTLLELTKMAFRLSGNAARLSSITGKPVTAVLAGTMATPRRRLEEHQIVSWTPIIDRPGVVTAVLRMALALKGVSVTVLPANNEGEATALCIDMGKKTIYYNKYLAK